MGRNGNILLYTICDVVYYLKIDFRKLKIDIISPRASRHTHTHTHTHQKIKNKKLIGKIQNNQEDGTFKSNHINNYCKFIWNKHPSLKIHIVKLDIK